MNPFTLTPEDRQAIAQETARLVVEQLRAVPRTCPDVMTLEDAKVYVRRPSRSAFFAWCRRWKVSPKSRGRYSRAVLDLALQRERGDLRTPATLRKHQDALEAHAA